MTAVATLEFQIKRGVIDTSGIDDSVLASLMAAVDLYARRKPKQAARTLLPLMHFDWVWGECDRPASEVVVDPQDLHAPCTQLNCSARAGKSNGHLMLTTSVLFEATVRDGIDEGGLKSWLDSNAAWACGNIAGGWGYINSETNLFVVGFGQAQPRTRPADTGN